MNRTRKYAALGLACLLAAAAPVSVMAAARTDTPEFARSAEEWARLQDNRLEYEEIPDLIHEYNTTVINNRIDYRDYRGRTGRILPRGIGIRQKRSGIIFLIRQILQI